MSARRHVAQCVAEQRVVQVGAPVTDQVVEIGPDRGAAFGTYRGKTLLPAGTRLVVVKADGSWTLKRR
jgi:hypothetical protein